MSAVSSDTLAPSILFLGSGYAGHRTHFMNLQAHTRDDPRIRPRYHLVSGFKEKGAIERLPIIPASVKGRARAVWEARSFASFPRPDAIWSAAGNVQIPYLWSQLGRLRRPLILDLDWTLEQQEALAPIYFRRAPKQGVRLLAAAKMERLLWRNVGLFIATSNWTAESLLRQGVAPDRIRILPPGVDLEQWRLHPEYRQHEDRPLRLLFVGGDFERKGGPMLLELFHARFADRCVLDIVTREPVVASRGVRVHSAEANSPELRALYARADLFVLPTRAECFGIATVEAMASGLPVIAGDVGGVHDIVDEGDTGWLIEPTKNALARALELALDRRSTLVDMGRQARRVAEARFDGKRNDTLLVELLLTEVSHRSHR